MKNTSYICLGNSSNLTTNILFMVTQKLISFKVDSSRLESLDSVLPLIGLSRNAFLNKCLSICLSCVLIQVVCALSAHRDPMDIPFND